MSNTTSSTNIQQWASKDGAFHRQASQFRNFISREPNSKFPPEADRYHLFVSLACPWAHRTLIVRGLKGLDSIIGVTVVDPLMEEKGWRFNPDLKIYDPNPVSGIEYLRELYLIANPQYNGRYTVPVLWDKKQKIIVNNESAEIIRMFNEVFDDIVPSSRGLNFYPEKLRSEIDSLNEWIYDTVNNGVYKAGFATSQEQYEINCRALFQSLDRIEGILGEKVFLTGNELTEADIRLWTTIVRFDPVYHGHFKCNVKGIEKDYPNILRWARQIYQLDDRIANTLSIEHIKKHYYMSHTNINPTRVVPLGNGPDLTKPIVKK
ncbi:uncharacterized protein VTP21DRAFT_8995 [Calcarisporiella thermophila]|uniref:uncharacterized protein n=1 Tax=Calcarisporiella thermophila TaxID=911321 RepID=UPI0037445B6D